MSSIDIRHIVFDIGKVLIHYDPNLPYSRLVPDEAERSWFFANVCTSDWNIEQDRGRSWEEAEAILIRNHPEREDHIRAFRRHWHEMVPHAYVETVAIMGEPDRRRLGRHDADQFRLRHLPGGAEALSLPDPAARGHGLRRRSAHQARSRHLPDHAEAFDLDPGATLFIDDSAANVEGARAAGWHAVQFTGAERLKADLAAYGIQPSDAAPSLAAAAML